MVRLASEKDLFYLPPPGTGPVDQLGEEVLRWILSLTTSNSFMIPFAGDIRGLPMPTQWKQIILEADEVAVWNFEDLRGCFYLFRFPPLWSRLFCLNKKFSKSALGLPGDGHCFLGCTVCPMGFTNAMGLVQYLHRRMLIVGTGGPVEMPLQRELRKDRTMPMLRGDIDELASIW